MKKLIGLLFLLMLTVVPASAAESDAVLTLHVQNEGEDAELVKSYNADELAALAEKSDGVAYVYYKEGAAKAVVATEYVALDNLLADAELNFCPGQRLTFANVGACHREQRFMTAGIRKRDFFDEAGKGERT